jgi:hypothetical protein
VRASRWGRSSPSEATKPPGPSQVEPLEYKNLFKEWLSIFFFLSFFLSSIFFHFFFLIFSFQFIQHLVSLFHLPCPVGAEGGEEIEEDTVQQRFEEAMRCQETLRGMLRDPLFASLFGPEELIPEPGEVLVSEDESSDDLVSPPLPAQGLALEDLQPPMSPFKIPAKGKR